MILNLLKFLKDASASAIYGARGANGVILITTKKGRNNQKTVIDLNITSGLSNPARKKDFLNAQQYKDAIMIAAKDDAWYDYTNDESGFGSLEEATDWYQNYYKKNVLNFYSLGTNSNTDWQKALYNKDAPSRQVNLSFSGGTEKTRFFISGIYNTQDAIVINNKFYRYGARMNLEHNATDKLTIGINLSVDRSQLNRVTNDDQFSTPGQLVAQIPISPIIDPATGQLNSNTLYPNALYDAQFNSDKQVTNRTIGNVYGNYTFFPFLSFRTEFGADILSLNQEAFQGKETIDGGGIGKSNLIVSQSTSYNTNNYFTYTPGLGGKSKLNAVIGMSYLQNDTKKASSYGEQFPSDAIKNLAGATSITSATSKSYRYTFLSYFLRGNYSYMGKYLLSGSIRTDASSRFGPNKRYGWFPAVSGGWVLSEEKFLKDSKFLSFLKLRASWGLTGNAEIGESQFLALYGVSNYPNLPGYVPISIANPNLKWEKNSPNRHRSRILCFKQQAQRRSRCV